METMNNRTFVQMTLDLFYL